MIARLHRRHHGVHRLVGETEVPGPSSGYVSWGEDVTPRGREPRVEEERLLAALPGGFLPVPASQVLLMVARGSSGTAVGEPRLFRRWGKYFDSYSLDLVENGEAE